MIKQFDFGEDQEDLIQIKKNGVEHTFKIKKVYVKDQMQLASIGKLKEEEQLDFIFAFLDKTLQGDVVFSDLEITMVEAKKILNYVFMKISGKTEEEFNRDIELEQQRLTARPIQSSTISERAKAATQVQQVKAADNANAKE